MKKIETIYHHLLWTAVDKGQFRHTQQNLARDFNYSTSTVHYALEKPTALGAVRKASKFFVLQDFKKLLYYWANLRNIKPDILLQLSLNLSAIDIEQLLPANTFLGGYGAATRYLQTTPVDYNQVMVYARPEQTSLFQDRFQYELRENHAPQLTVLKLPPYPETRAETTTPIQTFVDLWNRPEWYAHDFLRALESKLENELLSR